VSERSDPDCGQVSVEQPPIRERFVHQRTAGVPDLTTRYHAARDAHSMPMYEVTTQVATLEPPPPELQQLLSGIQGNQVAMDEFVSVNAGIMSPADFFAPDHLATLMAPPAMSH
jgi:hypothetical protein